MRKLILIAAIIYSVTLTAQTKQQIEYPKSDVDYPAFTKLTIEAEKHRETHMVSLTEFIKWSKEKEVIILDTRSKKMYDMKHVKGAIHLNFSDFTANKLAEVIPSKKTKILIYCNNNLDKDERYFARKMAPLALNIPTFINLYGYGYKNVYELDRLVPTTPSPLELEGKAVKVKKKSSSY
ncbi:MAG: rhodanese-like domain-containing protein [Flavobacteriales bacterium]|nr:rhodanese-like domain-containing protein [Flavobacteriales bacterium]